jgi:hypothetical protein
LKVYAFSRASTLGFTMKLKLSPSMRRITITTQEDFNPMGFKSTATCCSYSCVMVSLLGLALVLPMLFITTALVKLDSIDHCIDGGEPFRCQQSHLFHFKRVVYLLLSSIFHLPSSADLTSRHAEEGLARQH